MKSPLVQSKPMDYFSNTKIRATALAAFALLALILLAGSLNGLNFKPAQPIGGATQQEIQIQLPPVGQMIADAASVPLWKQLSFWGILLIIVLLVSTLLSPEFRKKLLLAFLRVAIFSVVFLYLVEKNPEAFAGLLSFGQGFENLALTDQGIDTPAPVFEAPQISSLVSFITAFVLIALLAMGAWLINRWWQAQKALFANEAPLKEIASIAQMAIREIQLEKDSENAIIKCYERMSAALSDKRGLAREQSMTASEFSHRLLRAGLPREPVQTLTLMFESARYGGYKAAAHEVDEAVHSLNAILKYCGEHS